MAFFGYANALLKASTLSFWLKSGTEKRTAALSVCFHTKGERMSKDKLHFRVCFCPSFWCHKTLAKTGLATEGLPRNSRSDEVLRARRGLVSAGRLRVFDKSVSYFGQTLSLGPRTVTTPRLSRNSVCTFLMPPHVVVKSTFPRRLHGFISVQFSMVGCALKLKRVACCPHALMNSLVLKTALAVAQTDVGLRMCGRLPGGLHGPAAFGLAVAAADGARAAAAYEDWKYQRPQTLTTCRSEGSSFCPWWLKRAPVVGDLQL